jgi:hypothetical protein
MSRGQVLLNLLAAVTATAAAVWAASRGTPLHVAVLAWLPASAFLSALAAGRAQARECHALLALTLNIAAVLVLCGYAVAGLMSANGSLAWATAFAAGAALAGGNIASLSSPAEQRED